MVQRRDSVVLQQKGGPQRPDEVEALDGPARIDTEAAGRGGGWLGLLWLWAWWPYPAVSP